MLQISKRSVTFNGEVMLMQENLSHSTSINSVCRTFVWSPLGSLHQLFKLPKMYVETKRKLRDAKLEPHAGKCIIRQQSGPINSGAIIGHSLCSNKDDGVDRSTEELPVRAVKITEGTRKPPRSTYKLHLVFSEDAYALFQEVKDFLEADSDAETLRRSIRALDFIEPGGLPDDVLSPNKDGDSNVHIYFEPDVSTKARLDQHKRDAGWSFRKSVLAGLCVVAQIMHDVSDDGGGQIDRLRALSSVM